MASSSSSSSSAIANQYCCSLVILLTLLSSLQIQARDNQFFNKVSATNNYQPNFIPENENTYGLYSHDSTHLPPSSTTVNGGAATPATAIPSNKYLPKNYNPVAYVTEPDNISEKDTFNEERNVNSNPENNDNGEQKNYYNRNEEDSEFRRFRRPKTTHSRNTYYNGGSSFNSEPEGFTGGRFRGGDAGRERYFNSGSESNGFEPQGMSDTRFLENGKYYYDVDNEKFNSNHPYERLKNTRARNEYNNDNNRNYYEFNGENSMEGYQNEEFQDEENYNLP